MFLLNSLNHAWNSSQGAHLKPRCAIVVLPTLALLALVSTCGDAVGAIVYSNNFNNPNGTGYAEWTGDLSTPVISTSPIGNHRFLGEFGNPNEFVGDHDDVQLALAGLPTHTSVILEFDLLVIRSWDGDAGDMWSVDVVGSPTPLLLTTFSNFFGPGHFKQSYPDPYASPSGGYIGGTGAVEFGTMGYTVPAFFQPPYSWDSIYHFSFIIPHASSSIAFHFTANGLENTGNESWGLDNVTVATNLEAAAVPEPTSLLLLGCGAAVLLGFQSLATRRRSDAARGSCERECD
ncbi:MAG TPA: hypothetical protein VM165_09200 [Planctomycetaceae bacterium]|nr:hypothetical protein [Planctomycetaceae bacterium]